MREFKLSKPLNLPAELKKSVSEARQADQLTEYAAMRAFEVYRVLKFARNQALTPEAARALERLDRATSALSDAKASLGDAVYQVEKVLQAAGVQT